MDLIWKSDDDGVRESYRASASRAVGGRYLIQSYGPGSLCHLLGVRAYRVRYMPKRGRHEKLNSVTSLEKAKAVAEAHHRALAASDQQGPHPSLEP